MVEGLRLSWIVQFYGLCQDHYSYHFHTLFLTLSHTLHTLFTQSELLWPNMDQPYNFWCLKICTQAGQ